MVENGKKTGALRHVVTALVALGIFALAVVVIYPKLQSRTEGPVRLDLLNGTGASMLDPTVSLRVPADQTMGTMTSTISNGALVTVYDGLGPIEIESISFTTGADGGAVTHEIHRTLEPGGIMVLRVTAQGVTVDASEFEPQTP